MAGLSTHILDTSRGKPADNIRIELFSTAPTTSLGTFTTNSDGRTDQPLIAPGNLKTGTYELHFHAGDYLRANGASADEILFLDIVIIRFGINNADQHYHVPLLLSPFGYSTYRGS